MIGLDHVSGGSSGGSEETSVPASRKVGGEIAPAFALSSANFFSGGSRGGSDFVREARLVGNLTNGRPLFTELRRAGYEIRTHDLQLGNLTRSIVQVLTRS